MSMVRECGLVSSDHCARLPIFLGSTPIERWYSQSTMYNFTAPGVSASTIDFTQLIWKETTQFGIGIAFNGDKRSVKIVANFYPAGNVVGVFASNVPSLCTPSSNSSTNG